MSLKIKKIRTVGLVAVMVVIVVFIIFWQVLESRTGYLFNITQNDPLFYSPKIDTQALDTSVSELKVSERVELEDINVRIKNGTLTNSDSDIEILKQIYSNGFLPISYLQQLPKTIEATEVFLQYPNTLNGLKMLSSTYFTARKYHLNGEKLYAMLQKTGGKGRSNPTFEFISSRTNRETLEYDGSLIEKNGRKLINETTLRIRCFLFGKCSEFPEAITKNITQTTYMTNVFPSLDNFSLLPDEKIVISGRLENAERSGPYIIESTCFPSKYVPMYIYKDDEYGFMPKQADEIYYSDFVKKLDLVPTNRFANYFKNKGVYYDDVLETAEYGCTDLSYWGDLSTLKYFTSNLNYDVTSIADLDILYEEFSKNPTSKKTRENILIIENRIIHLPDMLTTLSSNLDFHSSVSHFSDLVSPMFLLGIRSAYSLTYGTFSKSIWRLNEQPKYLSEKNIPVTNFYTTYNELSKQYSDEEINSFRIDASDYLVL